VASTGDHDPATSSFWDLGVEHVEFWPIDGGAHCSPNQSEPQIRAGRSGRTLQSLRADWKSDPGRDRCFGFEPSDCACIVDNS